MPKQVAQQVKVELDPEKIIHQKMHDKIQNIMKMFPDDMRVIAKRLIEQSNIEDNDLLYWDLMYEAYKAGQIKKIKEVLHRRENSSKARFIKIIADQNDGICRFEDQLKSIKGEMKSLSLKPKKETWKEWIKSPTGIAIITIGILVLIF